MHLTNKFKGLFSPSVDVGSMQSAAMIRFGLMWLVYIGLAKSDLSLGVIAQYELFIFLANLFAFALMFGGKKAILNSLEKGETDVRPLLGGALLTFTTVGIVVASLFLVFSGLIEKTLTEYGELPSVYLLSLYIFLLISSSVLDFFLLIREKYRWVVRQSWIFNGLMVIAVLLPMVYYQNLVMAFWAMNGVLFLQLIAAFIVGKEGLSKLNLFPLNSFLIKSFIPLTLFALLGGLSAYIDGYLVLTLEASDEVFAIFRYGARELPLATLMTSGIVSALVPVAVKDKHFASMRLKKEIKVLYWQLFPITIALVLLSPIIYPLIFSPEFAASAGIFNIYLLLLFSRLLIPQVFLFAQKKNQLLVASGLVEIVFNVSLSIILFDLYGVYGIAWASIIAFMVSKGVMWFYVVRYIGIPAGALIHIKLYSLFGTALIAAYLISLTYTQWI